MKEEQEQEFIVHEKFLEQFYHLQEKLGSGSYGIVYKANNIQTNEIFAIKCCKGESFVRAGSRYQQLISASTLREISTLKQLSHENILPVPYIQIEVGRDNFNQQSQQIRSFNQAKIITQGCCTLLYRSIEMLLGETKYSFEIDIWSCGCVLYELIFKKPLFNSDSQIGMIMEIFQKLGMPKENQFHYLKDLPYFSKNWPKFQRDDNWIKEVIEKTNSQCGDLLEKMLELDPRKRITVNDALLHPFFYSL